MFSDNPPKDLTGGVHGDSESGELPNDTPVNQQNRSVELPSDTAAEQPFSASQAEPTDRSTQSPISADQVDDSSAPHTRGSAKTTNTERSSVITSSASSSQAPSTLSSTHIAQPIAQPTNKASTADTARTTTTVGTANFARTTNAASSSNIASNANTANHRQEANATSITNESRNEPTLHEANQSKPVHKASNDNTTNETNTPTEQSNVNPDNKTSSGSTELHEHTAIDASSQSTDEQTNDAGLHDLAASENGQSQDELAHEKLSGQEKSRLQSLRAMLNASNARYKQASRKRRPKYVAGLEVRILSGEHRDKLGVVLDADYIGNRALISIPGQESPHWIGFRFLGHVD